MAKKVNTNDVSIKFPLNWPNIRKHFRVPKGFPNFHWFSLISCDIILMCFPNRYFIFDTSPWFHHIFLGVGGCDDLRFALLINTRGCPPEKKRPRVAEMLNLDATCPCPHPCFLSGSLKGVRRVFSRVSTVCLSPGHTVYTILLLVV